MIFVDSIHLDVARHIAEYVKEHNATRESIMPHNLKYAIQNNHAYRANPDNRRHDAYQSAINRRFAIAVFVFVFTWIHVLYGLHPALAFTFGIAVVTLLYFITTYALLPMCKAAIEWFIDWISGY